MRSIAILVMLVAPALAEAPRKPWPRWTDWVGSYEGKLVWKRCSAPGNKQAAIPLVATDGVMAVDLAAAHAGLRSVPLVSDDVGWTAKESDLRLSITRPRPNTIEVTVALASGCTMKAQLRRATTTVPECDRLIGWARVEASCKKLANQRGEELAKLVANRWTQADAAGCSARADKLERAVVDASCAPHPNPLVRGRGRDCTGLQLYAAFIRRCSVPPDLRDEYSKQVDELMKAIVKAEGPEVSKVEAECRSLKPVLEQIALTYRCMKAEYSR
jgi:hypothetical protein